MRLPTILQLLLALGLLAAGCGDSMAPASRPNALTGKWSYSYVAIDTTPCSIPGLVQGCSGAGTLDLVQFGPKVSGDWTVRGGCQTCGAAGDFATGGSLDAAVSGTMFEFALQGAEFLADLPQGRFDTITGTVSTDLVTGNTARGTWTMTRVP